MICRICGVVMIPGTTYQRKDGRNTARRYNECPKCKDKVYNSSLNFHELLYKEIKK